MIYDRDIDELDFFIYIDELFVNTLFDIGLDLHLYLASF